jgi:hypothetical protein
MAQAKGYAKKFGLHFIEPYNCKNRYKITTTYRLILVIAKKKSENKKVCSLKLLKCFF